MSNRRKFLRRSLLGTLTMPFAGLLPIACTAGSSGESSLVAKPRTPTVVSTWPNVKANEAAWQVIADGGRALDAVEQGVRVVEADPEDMSVGYGGRPDREGHVTLDACIMDENGNGGSVCFLEGIMHPISVARRVMENTPHVILAGSGALQFALAEGFTQENLLTAKAKAEWEEWKKESKYQPVINIENHDTIGMLAIDREGRISGACTTSGMAYKMHGRVGDSPILGAGLFVDNEVGGAVATGVGEAVLKTLGSFLVVELMRQGRTPQEACEEAVNRILKKTSARDFQVGYLAIDQQGNIGAYSIHVDFSYTGTRDGATVVTKSKSVL